jgi:hypothetical protein
MLLARRAVCRAYVKSVLGDFKASSRPLRLGFAWLAIAHARCIERKSPDIDDGTENLAVSAKGDLRAPMRPADFDSVRYKLPRDY